MTVLDAILEVDSTPSLAKKLGMDLSDGVLGKVRTKSGSVIFSFRSGVKPDQAANILFGVDENADIDAQSYAAYFLTNRARLFSSKMIRGGYYKWVAKSLDAAHDIFDSIVQLQSSKIFLRKLDVEYLVSSKRELVVTFTLNMNRGLSEYELDSSVVSPEEFKVRNVTDVVDDIVIYLASDEPVPLSEIFYNALKGNIYSVGYPKSIAEDVEVELMRENNRRFM